MGRKDEIDCGMTLEETGLTVETFPVALKRKEAIIEEGLKEAARILEPAIKAFQDIKRYKLYRETYPGYTFREYCQERWQRSGAAMYYLLAGKQVAAENVHSNGRISDTALGQHIARLPKSKQKKVLEKLTANNHSPTVSEVKRAVDEELGIVRKASVPKALREEFERTGVCPICGSE